MTPDIDIARAFLNAIDPGGIYTFQTADDDKERKAEELAKVLHGTIDQHYITLSKLNSRGAGIFVMVNKGDLRGRSKHNVLEVRSLFVDLDDNGEAGLAQIKALPDNIRPQLIVESSPNRYHAYWLLKPGLPLERFKPIQIKLAAKFGGDPKVKDLPRVMRIAGFINRKRKPFLVRVITHD